MGVPVPEMNEGDEPVTDGLLGSLRTISAPERRKHASVYNYWLSIRRGRQFPPIRDLDPLEISDAGPFSLLFEMIGGGEDAEIRHIGQAIKRGINVDKVGEAPNPSLLSCIATRLPVVAGCRDAFAFEDEFETEDGKARCWVTLLPFSATGTWIDYVYGFVSLDSPQHAAEATDTAEEGEEVEVHVEEQAAEIAPEPDQPPQSAAGDEHFMEITAIEDAPQPAAEDSDFPEEASTPTSKGSLSARFFETIANVGGFYGRPVEIELDMENATLESWEAEDGAPGEKPAPAEAIEEPLELDESAPAEAAEPAQEAAQADEPLTVDEPNSFDEPIPTLEGTLLSKLSDVRAKADEARQAKLRANAALYEGLSAAYDFALDAEDAPEEYLQLVQAEGLKIQLRSPMRPIAKLAFNGMCDEMTITQLEAILAWAFDEELPRGTLAERIEAAGGIGPILTGAAKAA